MDFAYVLRANPRFHWKMDMYVYFYLYATAAPLSLLMWKIGAFLGPGAFVCSFCESSRWC